MPVLPPMPTQAAVGPIGIWTAYHPKWQGKLEISANSTFKAGNFGMGGWTFDGRHLILAWTENRPNDTLELRPDGTFYRLCPEGSFVLRKT